MIRIAMVGMGLIGTSLGMALRNADVQQSGLGEIMVTGFDPDRRALSAARGRLAIDREASSLADAIRDAQLVVLATPVLAVRELLSQIAPNLALGAVVTDVCSTKSEVMAWAQEVLPTSVDFIGGHPMAGRERSGPEAADPELFQEAIYCLVAPVAARQESIELVELMVRAVGAKPYFVDAVEHDSYVAGISHLPFVLSAALVEIVSRSPAWREMQALAATGFRDVTRLASGNPQMHRDICLTNRQAIRGWIKQMVERLQELDDQLETQEREAVEELFSHAREQREVWLNNKPGMRPGEAEFLQQPEITRPSLFGRPAKRR